jgi:hypothetical protein
MNWIEDAPDFAARVMAAFDAHKHKTLATLRKDGSPRISGTEAHFRDGAVWFGSMERGVKALDLLRDGRFALHSAPLDVTHDMLDAKVAGTAVEVHDEALRESFGVTGENHLFRAEVREVVLISIDDGPPPLMVIESWHPGRGYERRTRD